MHSSASSGAVSPTPCHFPCGGTQKCGAVLGATRAEMRGPGAGTRGAGAAVTAGEGPGEGPAEGEGTGKPGGSRVETRKRVGGALPGGQGGDEG